MKHKGGLVAVSRQVDGKYYVQIVMRGLEQTSDDYHATVTRLSDDIQLVFISNWKWLLGWKIRSSALDRAFKSYDKRKRKLDVVEERVI